VTLLLNHRTPHRSSVVASRVDVASLLRVVPQRPPLARFPISAECLATTTFNRRSGVHGVSSQAWSTLALEIRRARPKTRLCLDLCTFRDDALSQSVSRRRIPSARSTNEESFRRLTSAFALERWPGRPLGAVSVTSAPTPVRDMITTFPWPEALPRWRSWSSWGLAIHTQGGRATEQVKRLV